MSGVAKFTLWWFAMLVSCVCAWFALKSDPEEQSGGSDKVFLIKVFQRDCFIEGGSTFLVAEVESMPLCNSIQRAYNFARIAERPERFEEFGMCWDRYAFFCSPQRPERPE